MKELIDKQPNELMKIRMMRTFISMGKTMVTVEGRLNPEIYKKREAITGENKAGVIQKKRGAFAYALANNAIYIGLGKKVGEGTSKIVSSAIKINHFNPAIAQKKQIEHVVRVKIQKPRSEQIKKYLPHQLANYNKRLELMNAEIEGEANSLDALKSDHIMKGYEFRVMSESPKGLSPQLIMFQTQYQTYDSLITNKAGMRQKLNVLTGVARGLASIHAKGKAHLDMKPDNMLIEGNIKSEKTLPKGLVADVGTVKEIGQEHASGTTVYFSPQLFLAYQNKMTIPADIKEDSFSFGLSLYQLLTNQPYIKKGDKLPTEFYNLIYAIRANVKNENDFNSAVNQVIEKMKQKKEFKKDRAMLDVLDICKSLLTYNPQARMSCKEAAVALEKVQKKYHLA